MSRKRDTLAMTLTALAAALVAMSNLARIAAPEVREAEINPLIVKPAGEGVVAVDGLIVLAEPSK